ncbi:MAG: G1 family glutamic endopeptidase [Solirubrobacteraceae bacterium]
MKRVIGTFAAVGACALGVATAASAQGTSTQVDATQQAASANWAGYVAGGNGTRYRSVSGTWVQPTASCQSAQGYAAFWVGLGGAGMGGSGQSSSFQQTGSLEQAGTQADCSGGGTPTYYAWYELVPSAPVHISMAIHPGDTISSTVAVNGSNVTIDLTDHTTGASFSKTLQMSNPDVSSAEWIAEAPSSCQQDLSSCTPLPLADFGTVKFSNAAATTVGGHTGTISDASWTDAALSLSPSAGGYAEYVPGQGGGSASPSALSSSGSSFSVAWSASSGYGYPGSGYYGGGYGYPGYGYYGGGYGYSGYGYPGSGYYGGGDYGYVYPGSAYSY